MTKDYSSFSGIAKVRFRGVAQALGFDQITGTYYAQKQAGWYNVFALDRPSYGGDYFTVNYGVEIPDHWSLQEKPISKNDHLMFYELLTREGSAKFNCETKLTIEASAKIIGEELRKQAVPWFATFTSLDTFAEKYILQAGLEWDLLGNHDPYKDIASANYAFILYRCGRKKDSLLWFCEAERIMDARNAELEDYEVKQLNTIKRSIKQVKQELE